MTKSSYQSHIPPPPSQEPSRRKKSDITLHVDIEDILEVSEVHSFIKIQYRLHTVWRDPRVSFWNLKKGRLVNIASEEEAGSLWYPRIVFLNTEEQLQTKVDLLLLKTLYQYVILQIRSICFSRWIQRAWLPLIARVALPHLQLRSWSTITSIPAYQMTSISTEVTPLRLSAASTWISIRSMSKSAT